MLMTGSLGMLASTLPVQWLLPGRLAAAVLGAGRLLALAMAVIAWRVPAWQPDPDAAG
jgi:hypothetical protein